MTVGELWTPVLPVGTTSSVSSHVSTVHMTVSSNTVSHQPLSPSSHAYRNDSFSQTLSPILNGHARTPHVPACECLHEDMPASQRWCSPSSESGSAVQAPRTVHPRHARNFGAGGSAVQVLHGGTHAVRVGVRQIRVAVYEGADMGGEMECSNAAESAGDGEGGSCMVATRRDAEVAHILEHLFLGDDLMHLEHRIWQCCVGCVVSRQ
ncbi:hypothetical protein JB92DRAFT_2830227 [Gautieria morchelliformis]|nr:hypothetical protein JB92DRAFT_2830227 [Gautieria morchelliformis]